MLSFYSGETDSFEVRLCLKLSYTVSLHYKEWLAIQGKIFAPGF